MIELDGKMLTNLPGESARASLKRGKDQPWTEQAA